MWQARRAKNLVGRLLNIELKLDEDWFALGLHPAEYDVEAFQGFHSENILIILDESPGISEDLYGACDSLMSSENAHLLQIGNPTSPAGHFINRKELKLGHVKFTKEEDVVIRNRYLSKEKPGVTQLAKEFECSRTAIENALGRLNVEKRVRSLGRYMTNTGYWCVWDKERGRWRLEHDLVWERLNERDIPPGFVIHHKDGDRTNNSIEDLELTTRLYHTRSHSEAYRIVNNEWEKYCRGCGKWRSLNNFRKLEYRKGHVEVATYCSKECRRFAQDMRDNTRDWPKNMMVPQILIPH